MVCKYCGNNIPEGCNVCPYCFQPVENSESQKQGLSNSAKAIIIAAAAAFLVILFVIIGVAASSGSGSSSSSSSSSEVTTYENGDTVYNPEDDDIAFDEESCTVYYDNLLLVYLNENISSQKADELAKVVNGEVMGSISGAVNMVQVVVNHTDLQTLEGYAEELMSDEVVMYATFDVPVTAEVSDFTETNPWDEDTSITVEPDEENPEGNNWGVEAIGAYTAWSYVDANEENISPATIGVIDEGFDVDHPDLQGKITMQNENSANSHGTHVTGIIAANNNNIGIRGIADKSDILCVDWTEPEEQEDGTVVDVSLFSTGEWAELTKQLIEDGAKVINNSWGREAIPSEEEYTKAVLKEEGHTYRSSRDLKIMEEVGAYDTYIKSIQVSNFLLAEDCMVLINQLEKNGYSDFLLVQAAGNGYDNAGPGYDAELSGYYCSLTEENYAMAAEEVTAGKSYEDFKNHIIIVGAVENRTDLNGNYYMTSFSNYGDTVDICAPGQDIYSTVCETTDEGEVIQHSYAMDGGTSMAAPMVTASAALLWSIDPSLSAAEVKNMLCTNTTASAIGVGDGSGYKYPMLNIGAVVKNYMSINVKGTVLDENGNPLKGVKVVAKDKNGEQVGDKVTTGSDGKYKIKGLSAVEKYTITYSKDEYETKKKTLDAKTKTKNGVEEGATIKLEDVKLTGEETAVDSGTCGDNLTWVLDVNGTLTISGTGKMHDYLIDDSTGTYPIDNPPWLSKKSSIKKVVINSGVTSIGDYAFEECTNLINVTIGNSVTSIGVGAFWECTSLASITIPNGVTSIGESAFSSCFNLTSITIPNSVTNIGEHAFCNCYYLTSITIPDSITSIGFQAFYNCTSLTSITIPKSVTSIGDDAFAFCTNLASIKVNSKNANYSSSSDGVLFNKKKTKLICCPGGKTGEYTIPNGVKSIGDWAFYYCTSLTSVTIPNSVTSIGYDAFYNCGLKSITIPNSVTSIGKYAFGTCDSLTSVTIPNSVTSIGEYAFYSCDSLTSVTIGNGVTNIGEGAFWMCESLTSITIPNSVTSIDAFAFYRCTSLKDVYYKGSKNKWNKISIDFANSCLTNATIHYNSAV